MLEVLCELKKIRNSINVKQYRAYFSKSETDEFFIKTLNEILGHFDIETKEFIPRFKDMMSIIGDDPGRQEEFLETINSFQLYKRNQKGGGLKTFHKEFKQEYNSKVKLLKEYNYLYKRKSYQLNMMERERKKDIPDSIPLDIRDGIYSQTYSNLAIDWMLRCYPCSQSTLKQIIYYKPKDTSK